MSDRKFAFFSPYKILKMLLWNKAKTYFASRWSLEGTEQVFIKLIFCNCQRTLISDFQSDILFYQIAKFRANF